MALLKKIEFTRRNQNQVLRTDFSDRFHLKMKKRLGRPWLQFPVLSCLIGCDCCADEISFEIRSQQPMEQMLSCFPPHR
jgi:hypothetical protein